MRMFKFTVYRKVSLSRNFFLLILIGCLFAVGAKMVLAHEKIATYEEAVRLFESGESAAAEKEFRAAKLNVSVSDHNDDINLKLSILSPIREEMEDLDKDAAEYQNDNDIEGLSELYEHWQDSTEKWTSGTPVQKDMYDEMLVLTQLDKDLEGYFSEIKKTQLARLESLSANDSQDEEEIHEYLTLIPETYFAGNKTNEIQTAFQKYYSAKMNKLTAANDPVAQIVTEANRQFTMLTSFSITVNGLKDALDQHLIKVLTAAMDKEDYAAFAKEASNMKKLSSKMMDSKVFSFIDESKNVLLVKAKKHTNDHQFEEAIHIYEGLTPLEDNAELIALTNTAWDKYEPVRVLQRLYPERQFPYFVNATNKYNADSVVAAISNDGFLYFGKLNGEEEMAVTIGDIDSSLSINELSFRSNLSTSANPVILIDAKSNSRNHRYLAYEINGISLEEILDVEADALTIESDGVLLVDNPVGSNEGEQAYYEIDYYGRYNFTKIKVDYVEIDAEDIIQYYGQKVRFSVYVDSPRDEMAVVEIAETYNYSTSSYDREYVLLKGQPHFAYGSYDVIGKFTGYESIEHNGQMIEVPVVQVEKLD
jgi:hypothetical protein